MLGLAEHGVLRTTSCGFRAFANWSQISILTAGTETLLQAVLLDETGSFLRVYVEADRAAQMARPMSTATNNLAKRFLFRIPRVVWPRPCRGTERRLNLFRAAGRGVRASPISTTNTVPAARPDAPRISLLAKPA